MWIDGVKVFLHGRIERILPGRWCAECHRRVKHCFWLDGATCTELPCLDCLECRRLSRLEGRSL